MKIPDNAGPTAQVPQQNGQIVKEDYGEIQNEDSIKVPVLPGEMAQSIEEPIAAFPVKSGGDIEMKNVS